MTKYAIGGRRAFTVGVAVALCLTQPSWAWNFVTHRVIAAIAYDHLEPGVRSRVDALIKLHPDYAGLFVKDAPLDETGRARAAFIIAATWADQIRSDRRFYNEAAVDAVPTPTLDGFPDMKRHEAWHFIDLPFSQDGTALGPTPEPNIVTELERLIATVGRPGSEATQVYDLPWLMHLVGDVHAPLHCVSRFSAENPKGDLGGNLVFVSPSVTLHKLWDDAVGTELTAEFVDRRALELEQAYAVIPADTEFDAKAWAGESLSITMRDVYALGDGSSGTREHPVALPDGYEAKARKVAAGQAARAGFRLAGVLNQGFH